MNYLFTICGRAGSKGVKNKNLRNFCGTPLVYYTLATIKLYVTRFCTTDTIDIVLNTDSEDLITLVQKQKAITVDTIRRDASLAGDSVPKVAVIKDCLEKMEDRTDKKYDVVIDLDITSPLRKVEDVKNAIDKKFSRDDTDVVYSVTGSRRNPYFNMVKEEAGYFVKAIESEYTTRQQAPVFYDMNASIYAYSPKALKEKEAKVFFNSKADAVVMKDTAVLDIDSEEDFELMQVIAEYLFEHDKEYNEIKQLAQLL